MKKRTPQAIARLSFPFYYTKIKNVMEIEERHEEVMGYSCDVFGRGTAGPGLTGAVVVGGSGSLSV